jgi:parallel beta-helix repeat protein
VHSISKVWLLALLFIIVIGLSYPSQENDQIVQTQNDKLHPTVLLINETQEETASNSCFEINVSKPSVFPANTNESIIAINIDKTSTLDNSSTMFSTERNATNISDNINAVQPKIFPEKTAENVMTFKTGELEFNQTMQVTSNTLILGQQNSVLRFFGNSYLNLTGDNITICGLTIEGDGLNNEFGIRAHGNFITVENCSVNNIGVTGLFGFGITYEYGSEFGNIINNHVENTGLDGIHIRGNSNTTVLNNTVIDSNDDGIASIFGNYNLIINNFINRQGSKNLAGNGIYTADIGTIIEGNYIEYTPLNGIVADHFQGYQARKIDILNNTVKNAGILSTGFRCSGILLNYACDSIVAGNMIENSLYDGIRVYNGSRNYIAQNIISNWCGAEDNWGCGILLEYQSSYNFVSAHKISNETYFFAETGLCVDYNVVQFTVVSLDKIHIEGLNSILLPD